MKNGNVREFVDHIHYGDELWFIYDGKKYFLEGWTNNDILELCLYEMSDNGEEVKVDCLTDVDEPIKSVTFRSRWIIDTEIPIFKGKGREYIDIDRV